VLGWTKPQAVGKVKLKVMVLHPARTVCQAATVLSSGWNERHYVISSRISDPRDVMLGKRSGPSTEPWGTPV